MSILRFLSIAVRRTAGIRPPGFTLPALSEGINVVHGPNGSGKTTTARAIHALLWPMSSQERASLDATVRVGDDDYRLEVEGRRGEWRRRDGADGAAATGATGAAAAVAAAPDLPPAEVRARYLLSLDELLAADREGFAELIERESAGGYNVPAAAQALGFRRAPARATAARDALNAAEQELAATRRSQADLERQAADLPALEAKRAAASAARARLEAWTRALERIDAAADAKDAADALAAFPAAMPLVHGDEVQRLADIAEKLEQLEGRRVDAQRERSEAEQERADSGLERVLPLELLPALEGDLDAARSREQEHASRAGALAAARSKREDARRELGDAIAEERLRTLPVVAFHELDDFARRATQAMELRARLAADLQALGPDVPGADDPKALQDAARALRLWLRASDPLVAGAARPFRLTALVAAAALVALGLVLGLRGDVVFAAAAAIVGVGVAVVALLWPTPARAREGYEKEYRASGLDAPAAWSDAAVEARLRELEARLAAAEAAAVARQRRADLRRELAAAEEDLARSDEERETLSERFGVSAATSPTELLALAGRIARWQDAQREVRAGEIELERLAGERDEVIARAAARLRPYGIAEPTDAASLKGARAALEARGRAFLEAEQVIRHADDADSAAAADAARLTAERAQLFTRLQQPEGDVRAVEDLCARLEDYRAAVQRRDVAAGRLDAAEKAVAGFADVVPGIRDLTRTQVLERRRTDEEAAQALERLLDKVSTIRHDVENARRGHDLEAALARRDDAAAALEEKRDEAVRAAIGACIAEQVQAATADRGRPPVFHRARELFAAVTAGRYRLELSRGPTAFRAFDTITSDLLGLDQLSSATRVQLLLCVRVAFVETQEHGARLPLLLDEALGNSDDARAQAIMRAVLELARGGRQVFYFTAQPDEVGKWRGVLEGAGVPFAFVDLARTRDLPAEAALDVVDPPRERLPDPGLDHAAYGRALPVPPLDHWNPGGADGAHLWYLCDDVPRLHALLEQGVRYWGQARLLAQQAGAVQAGARQLGAAQGEPSSSDAWRELAARAAALDALLIAWREGRGRPVDDEALAASGAVSPRMLPRVHEACAHVGGDGAALIRALAAGRVSGFLEKKRQQLVEYLAEHGYLDERPRLPREELLARAAAAADLPPREVERLLARARLDAPAGQPA